MNQPASQPKLFAAAFSEWLLVLPATVLLAAAALRLLQPRQYQPVRTSWAIFEWASAHITKSGAGVLFIVLPLIALAVGCAMLSVAWRNSETLRQDAIAALTSVRHHLAIAILGTGMLLAGSILAAVLVHIITD